MSKIDELIKQMCPEGVKYIPLGNLCPVLRGKRLTKSELSEDGRYKVFHGGVDPIGYYNQFNREAFTAMVINVGASAGTVGFSKDRFWSSDGCFCLKHNDQVNNQYLFYFLQTQETFLKSRVRHAGIPTLDGQVIEKIQFPLPPLPIQEAIADILDKFDRLSAELQAELQARKQQYEYYRNQLLTRFAPDQTKDILLENCVHPECSLSYGIVQPGNEFENGIPVVRPVDLTEKIVHKDNLKKVNPEISNSYKRTILRGGEILLCVRGTTGVVSFAGDDLKNCNVTRGIVPLFFKEGINAKYMYHLFHSKDVINQITNKTQGAALQQINISDLKKIKITIPKETEQARIVNILDKFEALVNDLSQGLPAEIAAVQEQYEYYRNKLLTFEKMS